MKIIDNGHDSVFIGPGDNKVELRIGEAKRGQSRLTYLSVTDAKILAYALLAQAERQGGKVN
jgi:hypothetical protein